jgi:hypothetical protein
MKHPNSNIQAPAKHQSSNSKGGTQVFWIVCWNFSGAWSLELGAFI